MGISHVLEMFGVQVVAEDLWSVSWLRNVLDTIM